LYPFPYNEFLWWNHVFFYSTLGARRILHACLLSNLRILSVCRYPIQYTV
jgi:hypothetical protein